MSKFVLSEKVPQFSLNMFVVAIRKLLITDELNSALNECKSVVTAQIIFSRLLSCYTL